MAWFRTRDKPLSDWMLTQFTDVSISRRQQTHSHLCRVLLCDAAVPVHDELRCNTQHQPPSYASTSTQRGYADFRRHSPSSLVIRWLVFIRDQNCLCVVCCTSGIVSTWLKISITVTPHEHQPVLRQRIKHIKTLHHWSVVRGTRCEPLFTYGFPHKGSVIRKTLPWSDVSCRIVFNPKFISVFSCDVSDWLWTGWDPIPWICYEKSFNEFYFSIWNPLVFNQRLQLFVQSPQSTFCEMN